MTKNLLKLTEDDRRHCLRVFCAHVPAGGLPADFVGAFAHVSPTRHGSRDAATKSASPDSLYEQIFKDKLETRQTERGTDFYGTHRRHRRRRERCAAMPEVREAALIILYRLLFILYAEDRNLAARPR